MDKFTSRDNLKGPTFCIGVANRGDAFGAGGGQIKKQKVTEEIDFLMDAQFFKMFLENEDQDDADQVQRILPHILSAQEDYEDIRPLHLIFPIDEADMDGRCQDNNNDTQSDQRMDPAKLAANPCGLRHQQPNNDDADPLETQRKGASPRMTLRPCDELKNSSSSNNQYQNDCSSSHGESLDDDGNDSTDLSLHHSDINEPLPQDAAQDQQLQIHPSHQEEELDSPDNDHLPPAGNHALVDRDDAVSASSSTAPRTASPRRKRDILLGRGGRSNYHPGNQYLLQLIPEYFELYSIQTTKAGKKGVIDGILARLHSENRRFLSLCGDDSGHWFQVLDYKTVYGKVAHAMRDFRNNKEKQTQGREVVAKGKRRPSTKRKCARRKRTTKR